MDVVGWPVVAASMVLVAMAAGLGAWARLRIGRDLAIASIRATVQLLAVGVLLTAVFTAAGALWFAWAWVVAMQITSVLVVVRRAKGPIPGLAGATTAVMVASTVVTLIVTFGFGVFDLEPVSLVVVAGITLGNAVPTAVLAANQAVRVSRDGVGEIDAALALGFDRMQIVQFVAPTAARAALIPQVERTKVVGLIALPGAMTGLLLAGVDPVDAVLVQILVMFLVLGAASICAVGVVIAIIRSTVTPGLVTAEWVHTR